MASSITQPRITAATASDAAISHLTERGTATTRASGGLTARPASQQSPTPSAASTAADSRFQRTPVSRQSMVPTAASAVPAAGASTRARIAGCRSARSARNPGR